MKLLIASDIHGDLSAAEAVFSAYEREGADKLLLLGDLLYHGPRNSLPEGYNPKGVIELLNKRKNDIIAVRGNCDTEVDQMVLEFPILADYCYSVFDGITLFATHGHKLNTDNLPPLRRGDVLLNGHWHIPAAEELSSGIFYVNPGSAALPKGNFPKSYAVYENREFTVKSFTEEVIFELKI